MTAQSKITIKSYFETGDRPNQGQFVNLIDSYQDTTASLVVLSSATVTARGTQLLAATSAQVTDIGLAVLGAATSAAACNAIDAVKRSGDTMTGKLNIVAATSANAGINIGVGVSPQSPINGDIWANVSAAFMQIGATAYQIAPSTGGVTEGTYTVVVTCGTSGTITLDSALDLASYETNGNIVTVRGKLTVASVSSPVGVLQISLPFAAADLGENAGTPAVNVTLDNTTSANAGVNPAIINETSLNIAAFVATATGLSATLANQIKAATIIYFSATYRK